MIAARNVPFPGIAGHLLESQGHALALLIDVEYNALDFVTLVDDLAGMAHFANPAHVADVQQTVDPFFDFDEGAVIGQIANHAANDHAGRIALGHLIPRIGLNLFHPQRDFLLVAIDVEHLDVNLIANGNDFAGMVDPFGPAHLANVDQAFDAGFELNESALTH